ncbi:MAG: hypothetical protein JNN20_02520 [Betaproteobacteria bacterium]|nr:hypothetical protein [Betaproteobacteria bacterium]
MNARSLKIFAALTVIAALVGAWALWSRTQAPLNTSSRDLTTGTGTANIHAAAARNAAGASKGSNKSPENPAGRPNAIATLLATDIDGAQFLKALGARADISPADRLYYQAAVNTRCSQVKNEAQNKAPVGTKSAGPTDALAVVSETRFEGGTGKILDRDPNAAMRATLRERLGKRSIPTFCKDIAPMTAAELDRLWQAAAAIGDGRAAAILADRALRNNLIPLPGAPAMPDGSFMMVLDKPGPDYLAKITAGLVQADASAVLTLGPLLQQSFQQGNFVFGPNKETVSLETGRALWELLACDAGGDCSPQSSHLLMAACANQGQCNIPDLDAYYRAHKLSEDAMAQIDRLKPLFAAAMRSGDWSFIQYQTPRTSQNNLTLGGNHRIRLGT